MPRGKKNKGNSGPAPPPNNNKAKSPAETKVPEPVLPVTPDAAPIESEKSNDDLKLRLANAKERLHLLQEVIGGIGDPTDVDNIKASGIDAAKEKLNIIQDSVNAVKTTLLEVKEDAGRSITPDGSVGGTSKRRKNKKQHNQNPPTGFVQKQPNAGENKSETDDVENDSAELEQEDGTSTLSKKKRNRNKKKKGPQEQSNSSAPESVPQAAEIAVLSNETDALKKTTEPQVETKENSPAGGTSKNNKKNKKKGQQKSTNDSIAESKVSAESVEAQPIDAIKNLHTDVKTDNQAPNAQNEKNKNKKKKGEGNNKGAEKANVIETKDELTIERKDNAKIETDNNNKKTKTDNSVKVDIPEDKQQSNKSKEDPLPKKENEKKAGNTKDQSNKAKKDQKKGQTPVEKPVAKTENVLPTDISKANDQLKSEKSSLPLVVDEEQTIKAKIEPLKVDSAKNKKDKKKGQASDPKQSVGVKVEEKQIEVKESLLSEEPPKPTVETTTIQMLSTEVQPKIIDSDSLKDKTPKSNKDKNDGQTAETEQALAVSSDDQHIKKTEQTTPEHIIEAATTSIAVEIITEKNDNKNEKVCPQSQKNKKNKNVVAPKITDKQEEKIIVEQPPKVVTESISTEQIVADDSKATCNIQCQQTESTKSEANKNEKDKKEPQIFTPIAPALLENEEKPGKPESAKEAVISAQIESAIVSDKTNEIIANEPSKPTVSGDAKIIESKIETTFAPGTIPSLPKLDFSQVVKENKDKIPLMEVKTSPILSSPSEAYAENRGNTDSTAKSVTAKATVDDAVKITDIITKPIIDVSTKPIVDVTTKPIVDVVAKPAAEVLIKPAADITTSSSTDTTTSAISKPTADVTTNPAADATSKPTTDTISKPTIDTASKCGVDVPTPIVQATPVEASTNQKQNKAKTPERKGNQKNEQKKPQQGKAQPVKQKQDEPKAQAPKKEETTKGDIEKEVVKSGSATVPSTELQLKEETTKIPENIQSGQVQPKTVLDKLEIKSAEAPVIPKEEVKEKEASSEIQPSLTEAKALNKKSVEATAEQSKTGETQVKDIKSVSTSQKSASRQPEQQKQEPKVETSKKDQKKQNKMKGKAPQPPDIPMDKSLLSASMIDPPTAASDDIISHEESEDQSSLITSDSKNVQGSDFVQSADTSLSTTDETKSREALSMAPNNENKVTEIVREAKNSSPTSCKRNKDVANLKESVEMQEAKRQELPEKSAQQKLEPVQFPAVKLVDILEAKMTSPTVKPGNIAGNVRKLPKDNKRTDQLNIQQQKSRSKSPKENMAEKYVKNQKLASGDNKKQAAQNLKKEILNNEVTTLVTPISIEKEAIEATKIDANLSATEHKSGTAPISTAVTETEQVDNVRETDAQSKQKAESLPENATIADKKIHQSGDDKKTQKLDVVVAGKDENSKPKIAPKPDVSQKSSPVDRSKKSPAKSSESKTPAQTKCPAQPKPPAKSPAQSKSPTQTKSPPQSKSPAQSKSPSQASAATTTSTKPPAQSKSPTQAPAATTSGKSPAQSKSPSQASASTKQPSQSKSPAQPSVSEPSARTNDPQSPTTTTTQTKPEVPPKPNLPKTSPNQVSPISLPDEEEEFVEYKFTPRPVFISTACQICKVPLEIPNPCKLCQMVCYCSDEHEKEDQLSHGPLCNAIQEIAKKRGGHIYNNARILNDDDYRSLRVHTLNLCENFLKRHLLPFEREILLFPRLCCKGSCREWRQQSLIECKQCGQVSYCAAHSDHLPELHEKWCQSFNLYQKIVLRQKNFGRIEPSLPSKIMLKPFDLFNNIDDVFKILYKNYGAIKDECIYATLTQLATAPLTALYGAQKNQQEIGEVYTIHLIGAELQFEADTLDKWETFFLHLVPSLVECRVVFVGPELNAENLPLEILSRIRMCRTCRQNCRIVKFDFQCGILYHDYVNSSAFTKPDLVCFFNPGLYRTTGFNGLDTWPNTIKSATLMNCPIVVTSYTEVESPKDLERIQKESERPLSIVQPPHINPFASQRPERNFISDEVAPMIFKNFFCFCVK